MIDDLVTECNINLHKLTQEPENLYLQFKYYSSMIELERYKPIYDV